MSDTSAKLAKEIVGILKYNQDLPDSDQVLAVKIRLDELIAEVEKACAETHKRSQEGAVIIDSRPSDIPVLAEAMIRQQQTRGPAN